MNSPFFTSIVLLLASFAARAEGVKDQNYPSPDGRWKFIATWIADKDPLFHGHYPCELRDTRRGISYFKETEIGENEMPPHRISAYWSPDGRYAAINFYYGKIAYWVSVIEIEKEPRQISLFPKKMRDYDDFMTSTDHWLDDTSLEVEAYQPVNWSPNGVARFSTLVVRFQREGDSAVTKEK